LPMIPIDGVLLLRRRVRSTQDDDRKRAMRMKTVTCLGAMFCAVGLVHCSANKEPPKGELMLSVQTDMAIPKDVDRVRLEVSKYGNLIFGNDYQVGSGGLQVPATIALMAGDDPSAPVRIRMVVRQGGKARLQREAVTTVPPNRIALLRLPIGWLCYDRAIETTPGQVESTCPTGQTCVAGTCASTTVDVGTLPDYRAEDVYGGGSEKGEGTCLDTLPCFAAGASVPVDTATCTIDKPVVSGSGTNVAIVLRAGGAGICGREACLVPLDAGSNGGWTEQTGRITLPGAVCDAIAAGKAAGVALTTACETKTAAIPTCGPWSSIVSNPGSFSAGAPAGFDAGLIVDAGGSGS
jgi:hypothetical protein